MTSELTAYITELVTAGWTVHRREGYYDVCYMLATPSGMRRMSRDVDPRAPGGELALLQATVREIEILERRGDDKLNTKPLGPEWVLLAPKVALHD